MITEANAQALQECPLCIESFLVACSDRQPYSCPNKACSADFCVGCKNKTLQSDWRCPFCRCELDGAYVKEPQWLSLQEAFENNLSRPRRDSMFSEISSSSGGGSDSVSESGSTSDLDVHNPGIVRGLLLEIASAMSDGQSVFEG